MTAGNLVAESRDVSNFDRVTLRDYGELVIAQGEQESLTIETDRDILSKIETEVRNGSLLIRIGGSWLDKLGHGPSTSLTRPWISYSLTVKKLTSLEICGAVRVSASDVESHRLALKSSGVNDVSIESLTAQLLTVDLCGAGRINLTGQVAEQRITIDGMGNYSAPKLESKRAVVRLRGAGQATVWAVKDLDVTMRGLGSVEYYGTPTVKKNVSPLGSVTSLGNP
jgi:hypothetical protein